MEGPPWFEDLEIGSYDLVTISNSHYAYMFFLLLIISIFFVLMFIMLNAMLLDM